jgi:zeaxanthin glucosyltransferase
VPPDRKLRHFGVLSFTGTGHVKPLIALSLELKRRGHRITFFEKPKIEARVREAGLEFSPIEKGESPRERKLDADSAAGVFSDISRLCFNLRRVIDDLQSFLEQLPPAIRDSDVDALIVNEIALAGPTVAEVLRLPYFVISTSVPHDFGWSHYHWCSGYRFSTSCITWLERRLLELSVFRMRGPILHTIDDFRRRAGLGRQKHVDTSYPALAHITQLPECLDFPHAAHPDNFHYAGPFLNSTGRPVDFPWESLNQRPMIYASLGTTRNVRPDILRLISEACSGIDAQLVISLGGRFAPESFAGLPGNPLVVKFAPQLELLKRAAVVISHSGMNTVLEALLEGKPIVAIPIAYDQPAIAARLERKKAAIVLPIMRLSVQRIRAAVTKLLHDPSYRDAATELQAELRNLRGSECAANVIEKALENYTESPSTCSTLRQMTAICERSALLGGPRA